MLYICIYENTHKGGKQLNFTQAMIKLTNRTEKVFVHSRRTARVKGSWPLN